MEPTAHRYQYSRELERALEGQRAREVWKQAEVRGIAEENDDLVRWGKFTVAAGEELPLPPPLPAEVLRVPEAPSSPAVSMRFPCTEFCAANIDTVSAALALGGGCVLSFANADTPGGRYRSGGRAQEEDLCRLLPQLYPSLIASNAYPLLPGTALLTRGLLAVRKPGSYQLCPCLGEIAVISAAMPCGAADRRPRGGWMGSPWAKDVKLRIRSALHAAVRSEHPHLVLGAFGCGAFGNPTRPVAGIFREVLESPEFRGFFSKVVFAIIDPVGTGNLKPFREEISTLDSQRHKSIDPP